MVRKSDESTVVRELQELDGLVSGGATVGVQGEEQRRKNAALGGTNADGLGVGEVFSQLHMLLPVRQEDCNPPAGGVRYSQLGELLLKQKFLIIVLKAELKSTNKILA